MDANFMSYTQLIEDKKKKSDELSVKVIIASEICTKN